MIPFPFPRDQILADKLQKRELVKKLIAERQRRIDNDRTERNERASEGTTINTDNDPTDYISGCIERTYTANDNKSGRCLNQR